MYLYLINIGLNYSLKIQEACASTNTLYLVFWYNTSLLFISLCQSHQTLNLQMCYRSYRFTVRRFCQDTKYYNELQ